MRSRSEEPFRQTQAAKQGHDPFRNVAPAGVNPILLWRDSQGRVRSSVADERCRGLDLGTAQRSREPVKYQHRRNYEGYYACAGTGQSIWYESMTEYSALMQLDHEYQLAQVASQPFCILFPDNSRHYPDFFAVHASGQQCVYDVRPMELIDDRASTQFEKTGRLCERIGWAYEVLHGVRGVQRHNLEWLAGYRHQYVAPESTVAVRILEAANQAISLAELASILDRELPTRVIPAIYHLMWTGQLGFNECIPISWDTMLERKRHG